MENVVAARRLRKSYLKNLDSFDYDTFEKKHSRNIDSVLNLGSNVVQRTNTNYEIEKDNIKDKNKIHINFKTKLIVKTLICSVILFSCILTNLVFIEQAKANKYASTIMYEYNKEGSKLKFLERLEEISKNAYNHLTFLVPEGVATFVSTNYVQEVKPRILNFNVKEKVKGVFTSNNMQEVIPENTNNNEQNNSEDSQNTTKPDDNQQNVTEGIGGGGPPDTEQKEEEPKYEEAISTTSTEQDDVSVFASKNIAYINPVQGTITSVYGARDEIFDNVDPYHTGIDIANKLGTEIKSATQGKVVNVESDNKYYGKMVEIEAKSVIFRYGHMSEIKVSKGDSVTQGQIIGLMGSTGYSTGSHLHFEIRIGGRSVDPQLLGFYK